VCRNYVPGALRFAFEMLSLHRLRGVKSHATPGQYKPELSMA
jgi:hypothetical protein